MRKTYIAPQTQVILAAAGQIIASSLTGRISEDEYSGDAGVKESSNPFGETIFDD